MAGTWTGGVREREFFEYQSEKQVKCVKCGDVCLMENAIKHLQQSKKHRDDMKDLTVEELKTWSLWEDARAYKHRKVPPHNLL